MSDTLYNRYLPDYTVSPGETLLETLEALGMTQAELADRTGRPKKTINGIIKGKVAITPDTALQFERVLSIPASFWNNLERQYQETQARLAEQPRLEQQASWLKDIPVKAMAKLGWIRSAENPVQQLQEVLKFFAIASPEQWQTVWNHAPAMFRKSRAFQSDPVAIAAWLRQGEIEAQQIACAPFDATKFRDVLQEVRNLTVEPPEVFQNEMVRLCAQAGVAVVFVPELPKTRVCGATRWLTPTKALIQLSLRYKSDDQLWFTFFHDAGHILQHGKREVFLEDEVEADDKEQEADRFAAEFLIPQVRLQRFVAENPYLSKVAIQDFAAQLGIAPGIVVGRLQHDAYLPPSHCNDLKCRLTWATENTEIA